MPPVALALLSLSLVATAEVSETGPARIAVLPFMVEGLALDDASEIEATVRATSGDALQAGVLPEERTRDLLRAADTLGIDCDRRKAACVAELGLLFGVESVLMGRMRAGDDGTSLKLTVVDVNARIEVREVEAVLPAGGERAAVEACVFRLFQDPAARLGAIVVEADPGAEIFIDGVSVGIAPLDGAVTGITIGQHEVAARKDGKSVAVGTIRVGPGQTHQISLVDDDTISRDVVRTAGRTLLYGGGTALGIGVVGALAAVVPFVAGWVLFIAIETPARLQQPYEADRLVPLFAAYSILYDWQPTGMMAIVAALGLAFIGVGLSIGGGSTLLMLGPDEEALLEMPAPPLANPLSPAPPTTKGGP
jgi:hypothetical protein